MEQEETDRVGFEPPTLTQQYFILVPSAVDGKRIRGIDKDLAG
jgi:hypothetical protein